MSEKMSHDKSLVFIKETLYSVSSRNLPNIQRFGDFSIEIIMIKAAAT